MKKLFLLCGIVFNIIFIPANICPAVEQRKSTSILSGLKHMKFINKALVEDARAGFYVEQIRNSGIEAKRGLIELHELANIGDNKEKIIEFINSRLKQANDTKNKTEDTDKKDPKREKNLESLNLEEVKKEAVILLKKNLLDSKIEFLLMLHDVAPLLKPLVEVSLKNATNIDIESSKLIPFMKSKPAEASMFFHNTIKDEESLKQVCTEFATFCRDLWGALSKSLKIKRLQWLKEQKEQK